MLLNLVTHDISVISSASVIAAMGVLLLSIHFPPHGRWRNLRMARVYLALSFLTLASLSALDYMISSHLIQEYTRQRSVEDIITLFIASYQALLFTMTLLMFIQPRYVRKERVFPQFAIISIVGIILFLSFYLWESVFPLLFYAATVGYLFQLVYYTILFQKKYALCMQQLQEYYDEEKDRRLHWVETGFYMALLIGVFALLILFLKSWGWGYYLFIAVYTVFYVYMVCRFINYSNNEIKFVLPAVIRETETTPEGEKQRNREMRNRQDIVRREERFRKSLDNWIKEKKFSETDIGVEEIALSLGVDASFLRYYFRTYMHSDFRTWRSELRIREAQQILDQDPQTSLSDIYEIVGFNDKGNFHRQFQKITGTTPANYKQDCLERKNKTLVNIYLPLSVNSFEEEKTVCDASRHNRLDTYRKSEQISKNISN